LMKPLARTSDTADAICEQQQQQQQQQHPL
jgi:hypothetical protein